MPEATTFELRVWAEGSLTDAAGRSLDAEGNPIHDEPTEGDQPEGDKS